SRAFFSDLIVSNFWRGIATQQSRFDLNFVAAHDCIDGIVAGGGSLATSSGSLYCNGNSEQGFWIHQSQAYTGTYNPVCLKGNNIGLFSSDKSSTIINNISCQFNKVGMGAYTQGCIIFGNIQQPNYINSNTDVDILAADGGYVRGWTRGGSVGNRNPPDRA